jgi:hypothetical protein
MLRPQPHPSSLSHLEREREAYPKRFTGKGVGWGKKECGFRE